MQYFPQRYLAANTRDDCTENGRVKYCKPELVNIIQSWPEDNSGRSLLASQTCGTDSAERYCARNAKNSWQCEMCDAHDYDLAHNVTLLNDEQESDKRSCWFSFGFSTNGARELPIMLLLPEKLKTRRKAALCWRPTNQFMIRMI